MNGLPPTYEYPWDFALLHIGELFAPIFYDRPTGMFQAEPGEASIVWTMLAFWTGKGDDCTFVMTGRQRFEEAVQTARESFPAIWERFPFEVRFCSATIP